MSNIAHEIEERMRNEVLVDLARRQEPQFLSILLKDKDKLMEASSFGIKSEFFWDINCRFLYKVMHDNFSKYGTKLTRSVMNNIMDSANAKGLTEEKKAFYKKFWDETHYIDAPLDDFDFLKDAINGRHAQYKAYKLIEQYSHDLVHSTNNQIDLIKSIRNDFNEIDNLEPEAYCRILSMNDALEETIKYIEHRRDNPGEVEGIMTGIKSIDDIFNGFARGSYTLITGSVNGGKTTLMFNIAFNMAKAGHKVVYVTLEKAALPFAVRLHSLHAGVDYNRIEKSLC